MKFGSGDVSGDRGASARAAAEAAATREKTEMESRRRQEEDLRKRGLRGARQLFSGAGGFLGFPGGQETLGG